MEKAIAASASGYFHMENIFADVQGLNKRDLKDTGAFCTSKMCLRVVMAASQGLQRGVHRYTGDFNR